MLVHGEWQKRLPTQLFEAIFLALLFVALVYMLVGKKSLYTPSVYLIGYGVWRFVIEYVRDDGERGSSGISWLTPSQLTAIVLVLVGVGLIFLYKYWLQKVIRNVCDSQQNPLGEGFFTVDNRACLCRHSAVFYLCKRRFV